MMRRSSIAIGDSMSNICPLPARSLVSATSPVLCSDQPSRG